jgi:hypothetical protein
VRDGKVETVAVELGVRDEFAERVEVKGGLVRGDTLLIGGVLSSPVGSRVQVINADH